MDIPETLAKSEQLDQLLKDGTMPEIGGKKLAGDIGTMLADVRKSIDEAKIGIAGAVQELMSEVAAGKQVERAIRAEAAHVRQAFSSVLGNAVGGENQDIDSGATQKPPEPS